MRRNGDWRLPRFEVFQGRGGGYYWRLRAPNGRVVADGSEKYSTHSNAVRAARRVRDLILVTGQVVVSV